MVNNQYRKVPRSLIRIMEKWIARQKTGSLQINFVKGAISHVIEKRSIILDDHQADHGR